MSVYQRKNKPLEKEVAIQYIEARIERVTESGCWLWTAGLSSAGYGKAYGFRNFRGERAHRLSYESMIGMIPEGLVLDHVCRVRCCVNPTHLEAVTDQINILRGTGTSAINARKTACKLGHPFDKMDKFNRRYCSRCVSAKDKRKYVAAAPALVEGKK